ncbi:cyclic pyranopterin monophosphate synthase MoaC [uncultured Anaerococcus sp.]|uniref:cyclic pyranopterin monophosphate synthase MoaC n=1 Tax=uncultured Anaerococcus sp. TaxID=293428 RepID=UPI002630E66B|nr:cyclic pyranopterin monophosphate synthase MoaC [uncultured Anaerococcus sp.]
MQQFSHIDDNGKAKMVDVSNKDNTDRLALAFGKVLLNEKTYSMVKNSEIEKGDVLTVAKIAGIMAAKNTSNTIPMCHPINLTSVDIEFELDDACYCIDIYARCKLNAKTGVEMEALHAVSVSALTIYDMCKAVQKDIVITDIKLLRKSGGKSGEYTNESNFG